jgi:hypothetical protein
MDIFIIFIIFICYLIIFFRNLLYNYVTEIDNVGVFKETKSIYNNYFTESQTKNDRQLINNVAFMRKGLISNIYEADLKIMEFNRLKSGDKILIFNNNDCNFETFLAQNLLENKKEVSIITIKTNILEIEQCEKLVSKSGFDNIEVKYLNDLDNLNTLLEDKFNRIILRENIGRIQDRGKTLTELKKLLFDESSFIYLKTLVFSEINEDNFMLKKQFDIIDFWNYNFTTTQDIINDFKKLNFDVKYKQINIVLLSVFYNPQDIINVIRLYFVDLNLSITDIINWLAIYTLNLLHIKAYQSNSL